MPAAQGANARPQLTAEAATRAATRHPELARWLRHYPRKTWIPVASYEAPRRLWEVKIFSGAAGQVAYATVADGDGRVLEAYAGPQVAWPLARGGGLGGQQLNRPFLWLAFCGIFLLGLADLRRPFRIRNLDLLALLSFSVSLWYFNRGHVFASAATVYPVLAYLLARCIWVARRGGAGATPSVWPVWLVVAATAFLLTFRAGLTLQSSAIIDVGYAGVIGADRIEHGRPPYGTFPRQDRLPPCGAADASGEVRDRIQPDGRCETANPLGDTYGPVVYAAYLPGLWLRGWSGRWDELPAVRFTTILFDLLALAGLVVLGLRFGTGRDAASLAFAWTAYPFTQYAANANTNDALMPALLVWGFVLVTAPVGRGLLLALAGWAKFAAFILAPLWATYPDVRRPRTAVLWSLGFLLATAASLGIVFLDGDPGTALRVFYDRTISIQLNRTSPFSIWDWAQYHAGLPDLHVLQKVLQLVLVVAALAVAVVPVRKTPLQLAALSCALLLGFELVLTHWSLLYIPWFFPFAALALLNGRMLARVSGSS